MSKRIYLLPEQGQFYKANLHAHTTLSDGTWTPEQLKQEYLKRGYSVVAYTDHRRYENHTELNDENFVALAAYEIDLNQEGMKDFFRVKTYHINLYDCCPEQFSEQKQKSILPECSYEDIKGINAYLAEMSQLGFLSCYNHPYWSLQNYLDYRALKGLWGMEIYNYGCEHDGLYGYHPQAYDELLREGNRLYCVATDDNHNRYPLEDPLCDSFGGFTMIKAERLNYQEIITAMKKGDFYASMGPEIQKFYLEDNKVIVKTSPVEKIYLITEGRDCYKKLAKPGETICEAEFTLNGNEGYIRLDCRDDSGLHACSNAYFLDALKTL